MNKYFAAGVIASLTLTASVADAQISALSPQDLVGNWRLVTTPSSDGNVTITMEGNTEGNLDLPLVVTRTGNTLGCELKNTSTRCEIRNGRLIITARQSGNTMVFTLNNRTRSGFTGETRIRLPMLPVGSVKVGTLAMTRS